MEFEPITTQEELDRLIQSAVSEAEKRFEGYIPPSVAEQQLSERDGEIQQLREQNRRTQLEITRLRIAAETGVPPELAQRLAGENEEELRSDAEQLIACISANSPSPKFSAAESVTDTKTAAQLRLLAELKK